MELTLEVLCSDTECTFIRFKDFVTVKVRIFLWFKARKFVRKVMPVKMEAVCLYVRARLRVL